jgi:hypothetical protein
MISAGNEEISGYRGAEKAKGPIQRTGPFWVIA